MKYYFTPITWKLNTLKIILIFSTFFQCDIANSQVNLITNPGFETISTCPTAEGQLNFSSGWFSPSSGTSDLFSTCGLMPNSLVALMGNLTQPQSGVAFAGQICAHAGVAAREYITKKISSVLIAGKKYKISFYMNISKTGGYDSNFPTEGLYGICFSSTAPAGGAGGAFVTTIGPIVPGFAPLGRVYIPSGDPAYSSIGWHKVQLIYTANGGEEYITVGNFDQNSLGRTYVFVDTFSLTEVSCVAGSAAPIFN